MKRFVLAMAYVGAAILDEEQHRLKGFLAIARSVLDEEDWGRRPGRIAAMRREPQYDC